MTHEFTFKIDRAAVQWRTAEAVSLLTAKPLPALADPTKALFRKLAEPDAGPNLTAYLQGRLRVVVVVSDHTRAVGYPDWLPTLLDAINLCGIADRHIELLMAVGLHDPEPETQTRVTLGEVSFSRVRVSQHRCRDENDLRPVRLADGGQVRVNRRLVEDKTTGVILTGGIAFHYHAGFGGGRKAIFPGCAAYDDVLANHKLLLDRRGARGRNPNCQPGRLDGNPIYEQSVAVLQACSPAFLVNAVMAGNGKVGQFFCGDPFAAHRIGCDFLRAYSAVAIDAPADLAIAGAGGWPKDGSLYQAHKAYDNAARAVRPGGAVVFLAGLGEGLGPAAFRAGLDWGDIAAHREALFGDDYSIPAQTCLACREKAERTRTWVVGPASELHSDLRRIGFAIAPDVDTAVTAARADLTRAGCADPRVVVMPDAGSVLPVVNGEAVRL